MRRKSTSLSRRKRLVAGGALFAVGAATLTPHVFAGEGGRPVSARCSTDPGVSPGGSVGSGGSTPGGPVTGGADPAPEPGNVPVPPEETGASGQMPGSGAYPPLPDTPGKPMYPDAPGNPMYPGYDAPSSNAGGGSTPADGGASAGVEDPSGPANAPSAAEAEASSGGARADCSDSGTDGQPRSLDDLLRILEKNPDEVLKMSDQDLRTLWENREEVIQREKEKGARGSRQLWGNGPPQLGYNPEAAVPSQGNPGAALSPGLVQELARMPLSSFLKLRQRVMSAPSENEDVKLLQNSFWANGCTGIEKVMNLPQRIVDACLRHDFLFTVGPNAAKQYPNRNDDFGSLANTKLYEDIRDAGHPWAAYVFWAGVSLGEGLLFTDTPTQGTTISTMPELDAILGKRQASSE